MFDAEFLNILPRMVADDFEGNEVACGLRPFATADMLRRRQIVHGLTTTTSCMFDVMTAVVNGLNDYRLIQLTFNHGKYPGM